MASAPASSSSPNGGQQPSTSTSSADSCPDPDVVAALTMRKAMGSLLDNVGFTHAQEGPLNVLTDVAIRFMEKLCKEVKQSGEYCGRSQPAVDDLSLAFNRLKFDTVDFHSYLSQVASITPLAPLPLFPVDLPNKRNRINGYKASREERKCRPPHIPDHLPGVRPSGEETEDAHVPVPCSSTSVEVFETPTASFEKSKGDYLSRFECDVPGFVGAAATAYGMKKTDKDKNPPVLLVMKGRRTEEERRRVEEEERRVEAARVLVGEETNGIHHKFKKHKDKDKEKVSRPPSTSKVGKEGKKDKTPHKIRKEDKSRTNTPIIRESAPLLHPEVPFLLSTTTTTPSRPEKMEREPPRPLLSLNLFDDPAEEADIPLPRTPGRHIDSPDDEEPLFFDADPFGRNSFNPPDSGRNSLNAPINSGRNSFNGPSTSTPIKHTPTITDEERRRKEEKKAKKEERKRKKAAEEAEKEAMREAMRVAAKAEQEEKKRERERDIAEQARKERARQEAKNQQKIADIERREREKAEARLHQQQLLEKERKEREKAEREKEQRRLAEAEMHMMIEARKEQMRIEAKKISEDMERQKKEKEAREAKERKRKEEKRREEKERANRIKKEESLSRSVTPRVNTPKPRELEAIKAEEEQEDSSTIPFVMEDEPGQSTSGPTSFPLNMSMEEIRSTEERTVTPIKIKKHGEDGEKIKKKHKKDRKEREDEKDCGSNRGDEEERRREKERRKAKKREKRAREERERQEKEKRADQSPIQDKIDPNKSGLKLTIKLGGVSSQPVAPPPLLSTTPVPSFSAPVEHPTSLLKLKIKTPIDPKMDVACSSVSSVAAAATAAPPKPRPVTKAELKATPAEYESSWKQQDKKKQNPTNVSGSDSSSSSDDEEARREKERRKARKAEKERKREEERLERERKEREERKEKERQERIKQEKEKERLEKEKREREREREREKEKEKEKKKKQTAFDLALQSSADKQKKRKKEEPVEVIWICPVCSVAYVDGAEMIGCDCCDSWFHWQCVGLVTVPEGDAPWFCERCTPKNGEAPNFGKNKKKCTHWSGQYMDWNIKKVKKSRDYE